jgi:tetratricopeptide (TPR) repeat protein
MTAQDAYDLSQQGARLFDEGHYQAALGCFEQAADLARQSGDHSTELYALGNVAACWGNLGDWNKQAEAATRLLARARQIDYQDHQLRAILLLADALAEIDLEGRWHEIRLLLLEGLQTARQLGSDLRIVYHLVRLGGYARRMDEQEAAYSWLQDALNALLPSTENAAFWRSEIYINLSRWAKSHGDRAEALRYAEMAVGAAREDGSPYFVTNAQLNQARIQRWRGERGEALALAEEALATSRRINNEQCVVSSLVLQVTLLVELGLSERAQAAYAQLWGLETRNSDRYAEIGKVAYKPLRDLVGAETAYRRYLEGRPTHPSGWCKLALVLYDQGRLTDALHAWRESLKRRNENAEALAGLALGLWTQGERDEAIIIWSQALGLRPRCADPDFLADEWNWSDQAVAGARPLVAAREPLAKNDR